MWTFLWEQILCPLNRGVSSIDVTNTKIIWTFFWDQILCSLSGGVPWIELYQRRGSTVRLFLFLLLMQPVWQALKGDGEGGTWAREVSRLNSLPLLFRTPATQATSYAWSVNLSTAGALYNESVLFQSRSVMQETRKRGRPKQCLQLCLKKSWRLLS